jgi:hypothetical protein
LTNSKIAEKSFRTSKILTLLYQQFSNLLISQRDMSGPNLGALSIIGDREVDEFTKWNKESKLEFEGTQIVTLL